MSKTDNRDVTRATHSLTYVITVENTGNTDIHDVVVTDDLPSKLTVDKISDGGQLNGDIVTWKLSLGAGEKKEFTVTATVKDITDCPVLTNTVNAESKDHDLKDTAQDKTVVLCQPEVAGTTTIVPVPVTAKTGAGMIGLLSTLVGGAGFALISRRGF